MGGILINLDDPSDKAGKSIFEKKRMFSSLDKNYNNYSLIKYKKLLFNHDFFIKTFADDVIVVGCGSISYQGESVTNGFSILASELAQGESLNANELFGHYLIVRASKDNLTMYFDPAGYGAPYVVDNKFISSSFLACCHYARSLTLNYSAIFEELYSGCFLNGQLPFKEIRRIGKKEVWEASSNTPQVEFIPIFQKYEPRLYVSYDEALGTQKDLLVGYFNKWTDQISEFHGDIGLSSGFDSRTVLALSEKCYSKQFQVHSYWKRHQDIDNRIANKLTSCLGKELIRIPIRDRNNLTTEEFEVLIQEACYYYDGLFPSNHGWVREYRMASHRTKILGTARFGYSGIGGEQYRNLYHLRNEQFTFKQVITQYLLEDFNHLVLDRSSFAEKGMDIVKKSVAEALGLPNSQQNLSRKDVHRIYCEIIVKTGPAIRNQIENQLSFFLSPFTEKYLQDYSYDIIPYLGNGYKFQSDLISKLNHQLASIPSDYGFSFNNIPRRHYLFSYLSGFVPRKMKMSISKMIKGSRYDYLDSFGKHRGLIENHLSQLKQYEFPFPVASKLFQQDTIDRSVALATLLNMHSHKIVG